MTITELIKKLKETRKAVNDKDLFVTVLSDNKWKVVEDVYIFTPVEGAPYIRIDTKDGLVSKIGKQITEGLNDNN